MKTNAKPVAQKPLKDWLDQGMKEEIFNKVPDGEAIMWCSPLVVQPKPKFTEMKSEVLESHMIRASIDMRIPNQSMKRSRCVQSPRVEDFIYRLHDCKIFTKLDLRQGYHQLALDPSTKQVENSAHLGVITDPSNWCLEQTNHLNEAMFRIFRDIHPCLNQRDDILLREETRHSTRRY